MMMDRWTLSRDDRARAVHNQEKILRLALIGWQDKVHVLYQSAKNQKLF